MMVVVESPLKARTRAGAVDNFRFAAWACRALQVAGHDPIASHMVKPWFMDDSVPLERAAGIASQWFWLPGNPHVFVADRGISGGMKAAYEKCGRLKIARLTIELRVFAPDAWAGFQAPDSWPPHTAGFELAQLMGERVSLARETEEP